MTRHFCSIFVIFLSIFGVFGTKKYKLKLVSSTACESPTENMDTTSITFEPEVLSLAKHTRFGRSNFTVLRLAGPIAISVKILHVKGSKKKEIFKLEKMDCHNPITYQLIRVLNMKLNNDCKITPGTYVTEKINPQDFAWILSKATIEAGKYEFILQYYTERGLAICNSIICDIREGK